MLLTKKQVNTLGQIISKNYSVDTVMVDRHQNGVIHFLAYDKHLVCQLEGKIDPNGVNHYSKQIDDFGAINPDPLRRNGAL